MILSFLHGPIRIPMVFILQQDRDRRPRLHHIQRLRRYENWLSCRRLSRRVFLFVSGEGLFRFGVCFIIALFFYSFLIISLSVFFSLTAGLSTVSSLSSVPLHWQELPGRLQSMRLGARFLERSYLQGPGHRCCCRPEWSLGLL